MDRKLHMLGLVLSFEGRCYLLIQYYDVRIRVSRVGLVLGLHVVFNFGN